MNVRHILFLLAGSSLLGACSNKNLAQVEKDDMYFTRKDRKELVALYNVPATDVLVATADEQIQSDVTAQQDQQTYYGTTQNPDYVPGYYVAPKDGGQYDAETDSQYYVEGYNQTKAQSSPPVTNNYYFYGRSPYSYNSWYQPAVSISLGFGFGYSPYYSSFYNPYHHYYDPWYYSAYNPWYYPSYGYGISYPYYPYPTTYYGSSYNTYTTVTNYDNGTFQYADGRYVVNSPRRSRYAVSNSRVVATGSTTGRRTASGVIRSESNGRLASVTSRNTYRKYVDSNKSSSTVTTASGRTSSSVDPISLNGPNTSRKSNRQVLQNVDTRNKVAYSKSGNYKGYVKQGRRPVIASAPESNWRAQSQNNNRSRNNSFNRRNSNNSSHNSGNRSMFRSGSSNRSGSRTQRSNSSYNRSSSSFSRSSHGSGSGRSRSSASFSGGSSRSSGSSFSSGRSSSGRSSSIRSSSGGSRSSSSSSRRRN
jgi:hypothetical protein